MIVFKDSFYVIISDCRSIGSGWRWSGLWFTTVLKGSQNILKSISSFRKSKKRSPQAVIFLSLYHMRFTKLLNWPLKRSSFFWKDVMCSKILFASYFVSWSCPFNFDRCCVTSGGNARSFIHSTSLKNETSWFLLSMKHSISPPKCHNRFKVSACLTNDPMSNTYYPGNGIQLLPKKILNCLWFNPRNECNWYSEQLLSWYQWHSELCCINLILIYLFMTRHEVHSKNTHTLQNAGR